MVVQSYRMAVKETLNRGWWLPAGSLEPGESFIDAANRETKEVYIIIRKQALRSISKEY